jgi:hypothetical protein
LIIKNKGLAKTSEDVNDLEIKVISKPTDQAIKTYNRLKKRIKKVVAFLHLTC